MFLFEPAVVAVGVLLLWSAQLHLHAENPHAAMPKGIAAMPLAIAALPQ